MRFYGISQAFLSLVQIVWSHGLRCYCIIVKTRAQTNFYALFDLLWIWNSSLFSFLLCPVYLWTINGHGSNHRNQVWISLFILYGNSWLDYAFEYRGNGKCPDDFLDTRRRDRIDSIKQILHQLTWLPVVISQKKASKHWSSLNYKVK